jgi:acetyl-CoA carboxylase biotin carboxyl carrier protein
MASAEDSQKVIQAAANRPGHSLLNPDTLRRLFRDLEATDVDELEIVSGESRLYVRREPGSRTHDTARQPGARSASRLDRQNEAALGVPVVAPLTGVFYSRSRPDERPYVAVGDVVELGQVVGLIETMKIYNEVTVDIAGEVLSVHWTDGELVESGQPLLYVRPRQEGEAA